MHIIIFFFFLVSIPEQCVILICISLNFIEMVSYVRYPSVSSPIALFGNLFMALQGNLFHCCIVFHCETFLPVFFIPVVVNGHLGCCLVGPLLISRLFASSPWSSNGDTDNPHCSKEKTFDLKQFGSKYQVVKWNLNPESFQDGMCVYNHVAINWYTVFCYHGNNGSCRGWPWILMCSDHLSLSLRTTWISVTCYWL